jgi:hypothetical protein
MFNNLKKTKIMKNMFALMFVCATIITSCSTNESTTTETTIELVDTLYQDTVGQVENVDTTVNVIQ